MAKLTKASELSERYAKFVAAYSATRKVGLAYDMQVVISDWADAAATLLASQEAEIAELRVALTAIAEFNSTDKTILGAMEALAFCRSTALAALRTGDGQP